MSDKELDAWLAEYVMDYRWYQGTGDNNLVPSDMHHLAHGCGMWEGRNPERKDRIVSPLTFSSDPAASKQLLDRMLGLGWTCLISIMQNRTSAVFTHPSGRFGRAEDGPKEVQRAVALAAKEALEGEK